MPKLSDHTSFSALKLLVAADSGRGKTGGLASLVDAGYKLRILDFDNGVSTLRGFIEKKALIDNVLYVPLANQFKLAGKVIGVAKAEAFKTAMSVLSEGSDKWGEKLPPLEDWPAEEVLVVDSFSTMGRAALAYVMQIDGKGMSQPEIQHYGVAMENMERFLGMITSDSVKCNVIVNTHIMPFEDTGALRLYPEALGSKLSPKVGRYFDNMITISTAGGKKQYKTRQDGLFACKTAIKLAETYPLETGLADIFKKLKEG